MPSLLGPQRKVAKMVSVKVFFRRVASLSLSTKSDLRPASGGAPYRV